MQDEQIIDLYWSRSEDAIACTEQKYGAYCSSIAWHILFNDEDTEECVSDTWLHTWRAIPPTRPMVLKAFLGKITRNLALNYYEKRHASRRGNGDVPACLDELAECVAAPGRSDEVVERSVITETINRFLAGLPADDRKLFVQRYWYALPVKDIASAAGLGESAVKMKLSRMRGKLKTMLETEEVFL